ncbi:MAG: acyl-CoA thioesterase [Solirubrobacterales bacterium]|nr:acyl-CoA thioesterase [Solirubrobacterales bacterium]
MNPRPVADTETQLVHFMGPTDANSEGDVHGGVIMKLVDEAAALAAMKHARRRVVTAAMDRMTFVVPIGVGDLVTFRAKVNAAWRSSMEIGVRVESENPLSGEVRYTNSAYVTLVALDEHARPALVAPALAQSALEQRRMREAELRRANRLTERKAILAGRADDRGRRDGPRHRDRLARREPASPPD